MPLVRLQCPACESIVKISEEIAAQHALVRCAKCQGLVTVATSLVIEPVASPVAGDDSSYKPKKKKKKSQQAAVPVGMIVGIIVGLLVLVGAGIGIYFLIDSFGGSPLEKSFKKGLAIMQHMADAVDSIQSPQDVSKAFDQINGAINDLKQLGEQNRQAGIHPDSADAQKAAEKYMPEVLKLTSRMQAAMMKLSLNPALAQALKENAGKLGAGLDALAMLGGELNMPDVRRQPNFGNNQPRNGNPPNLADRSRDSTANRTTGDVASMQQLETLLKAKSISAKQISGWLEGVRDRDSSETILSRLELLIEVMVPSERKIEELERLLGKPTTPASADAQQTQREIEKTKEELAVHLSRIEKLPDLGSVHAKIVRKLTEVGLASESTTTASNSPSGKESSNPFEPAPPGNKSNQPGKSEGSNPFEPAGNGGKTMPPAGRNSSLEATLAKLTSTDHFKKQEGLREAQVAKFEEASKAAVLEALLTLSVDSDVHQKSEVLKAYKKWATTQEDKERLGEHAESLLKDPFAKKEALRYFGENKIISSSKEAATLLKDNFDRKDAAETLIAMGSGAEASVIPHLTDLEPQVRQMAIEVLARIGTATSVPELQKLKADRFVGRAASQAITLINSRKK